MERPVKSSVVALPPEGRGIDHRERSEKKGVVEGLVLRSYFTSTLVVCNPKLSVPQCMWVSLDNCHPEIRNVFSFTLYEWT